MSFLNKLKIRWKLESIGQVVIILIVFACTGFTILFLKRPIMSMIGASEKYEFLFSVLYYLLILPVYNIVLLIYGFLFRQFDFFWSFEKKMWYRMTGQKNKIEGE